MRQLKIESGAKALVLVAHPDDETIWMGGTIAGHHNVKWTIFVLCRKSDPDRMPKFLRVAKQYGAVGIICDLEDEGIMSTKESIPLIQAIIREELPEKQFDVLFAHASWGEYGHDRHKGVHEAVKELCEHGELEATQVFSFAYRLDEVEGICTPRPIADCKVQLTEQELRAKKDIVEKMYGFKPTSFESRSCAQEEAFNLGFV